MARLYRQRWKQGWRWLLVLIGLSGCTDLSVPSAQASIKIMLVGDSITQGDRKHESYRRRLWQMIQAGGFDVDFVGSRTRNHRGANPKPDFNLHHEGYWGWRVDQVLAKLRGSGGPIATHRPDIILIHLGSNDALKSDPGHPQSTIEELSALIDEFRLRNPNVIILLAKLIPATHPDNAAIEALNSRIPELAASKSTSSSPIIVVDHYHGFDPSRDTYDGIHPNRLGEQRMASKWYDALAPILRNADDKSGESQNLTQ